MSANQTNKHKLREIDAVAGTLGMPQGQADAADKPASHDDKPAKDGKPRGKRGSNRGHVRRNLRDLQLPEERIEIPDPHLEWLVEQGKCVRHGFEERATLAHRRATKCRVIVARVRYKTVDAEGNADVITTAMHADMLPSAIAAPSLAAHVIMENVGKGLPLFRLEDGNGCVQIRLSSLASRFCASDQRHETGADTRSCGRRNR